MNRSQFHQQYMSNFCAVFGTRCKCTKAQLAQLCNCYNLSDVEKFKSKCCWNIVALFLLCPKRLCVQALHHLVGEINPRYALFFSRMLCFCKIPICEYHNHYFTLVYIGLKHSLFVFLLFSQIVKNVNTMASNSKGANIQSWNQIQNDYGVILDHKTS